MQDQAGQDSIVVFDLEWTAWQGSQERCWSGPGEESLEIVQIGALKLTNSDTMPETEHLDVYVKPLINPMLSDYFTELTGISQTTIDTLGTSFPEALGQFQSFVGEQTSVAVSNGDDVGKLMLNCGYMNIDFPFEPDLFVNVGPLILAHNPNPAIVTDSCNLHAAYGFSQAGTAHNALDDCRAVAEALRILRRKSLF